jgi:hypothetical protein
MKQIHLSHSENFLLLHFKIDRVDVTRNKCKWTQWDNKCLNKVQEVYHRLILTFDTQFVENVTEAIKSDVNGNI